MKKFLPLLAFFASASAAFNAYAQTAYEGIAKPWQLNFLEPATATMERLYDLHNFLLVIISLVTLLVLVVLTYICIRFRRKANPVPSKTTHNARLEIIWTTIPILILLVIAIPSLRLHYFMEQPETTDMTLKVSGHQWYWHYEYPDHGGFGFDSYIRKGGDLKPGDHRLLAVDNHVVVPVDTAVKVLVTAADVIHAWAVPSFGVKKDAVPGRLNETWFKANKIGRYYGQCSELCGVGHGFMPIVVDVVSKEDFAAWVAQKKQEAGATTAPAAPEKAPEKPQDKTQDKTQGKTQGKPGAKAAPDAGMDKAAAKNAGLSTSSGDAEAGSDEGSETEEEETPEQDSDPDQE